MGWARTLLLGDVGNRLDIEDAEVEIERVKRELGQKQDTDRTQSQQIEQLLKENVQLKLGLAALAKALVGKGVLSAEDLGRWVDLIDQE